MSSLSLFQIISLQPSSISSVVREFHDLNFLTTLLKCSIKIHYFTEKLGQLYLLQHSFISKNLDSKPIRDLLLEYKAEVVEEEVVDDETDVSQIFILFFMKITLCLSPLISGSGTFLFCVIGPIQHLIQIFHSIGKESHDRKPGIHPLKRNKFTIDIG